MKSTVITRPLCRTCNLRPCAVNYHLKSRVYYRSKCERCWRQHGDQRHLKPRWQSRGYQKKNRCERCGFHNTLSQIFAVYVVDGDLNNTAPNNLRTVCANCQILLSVTGQGWRNADLISDF